MMSQGVSVPKSGQRPSSGQRKILTPPLVRRQQQSRSQDPVTDEPKRENLHQRASVGLPIAPDSALSLQPAVLASAKKGKPRRKSVDLPSTSNVSKQRASHNQPSSQIKGNSEQGAGAREKPPQSPKRQSDRRKRKRLNTAPLLYALRLLILGVGIGAIAGTLLSVLEPASRIAAEGSQSQIQQTQQEVIAAVPAPALKLSQEITPLKTVVQQLVAKNANLMPGVFFVDLDTGAYLDLNGASTFAAASTIKFPILVAFFQDVDAGKIRLDEMMTLRQELIGGGSGDMQYKAPGTKFTALETATKMITISDNTATNILIARLGGAAALNQRFQSWGLTATQLRNPLPDLSGTNTTSPRDLAQLMALVNQENLISLKSRDRLLDIMRHTVTDSMLPSGLGKGAIIAHKTGDIGTLVGDVGLVDMPNGKRYIAVAMVKRPHNDGRAQELIRQVSRAAYEQFNKPPIIPTVTAIQNSKFNNQ